MLGLQQQAQQVILEMGIFLIRLQFWVTQLMLQTEDLIIPLSGGKFLTLSFRKTMNLYLKFQQLGIILSLAVAELPAAEAKSTVVVKAEKMISKDNFGDVFWYQEESHIVFCFVIHGSITRLSSIQVDVGVSGEGETQYNLHVYGVIDSITRELPLKRDAKGIYRYKIYNPFSWKSTGVYYNKKKLKKVDPISENLEKPDEAISPPFSEPIKTPLFMKTIRFE